MKYFPASNFAIIYMTSRQKMFTKYDKAPNWWEENSFFKYPYMLISAAHGKDNFNFRETNNIPRKGFTLFADSGGFTQYKGDLQLDPIEILRWQENNSDMLFSLDYPITARDNAKDVELKNKQSIKYIQLQLANRKNFEIPFYVCTHAWSEKQLKEYHKQLPHELIGGIGCGECTVGVDDSIPGIFSRIAVEAALNPDRKPMHILGTSAPILIGFIALLERKYGIPMSYDSSSYSNGARYRSYHTDMVKRTRLKINQYTTETELPCQIKCPICSTVSIGDMKEETSQGGSLICLHNLCLEVELDKVIWNLSATPEKLFDWIRQQYGDGKNRIIKRMEEFIDYPLDEFVKRFPYDNKFNASRNVQLESWLGVERTEIRKAVKQLPKKKVKKVKEVREVEKVEEEKEYDIKDEDWLT